MNEEENTSISIESRLLDQLDTNLRLQHGEPDNPVHSYRCGRIYAKLGDLQNAVGFYRQALRLDSNYAEALLELGLALQSLGNSSDAEISLRAAVGAAPRDVRVHLILGGFLEREQRFDEALECVNNAISLEPENLDAKLQLGRLYIQRQELNQVRQLLEPLSVSNPSHFEVWNLLGLMHARTKDPAQARTCYQKALDISPKQAEIWTHLGNVLIQLDDESAAEHAYRQAVKYNPESSDFWFNLGEFYFQRTNHQAEHALMQAVRINRKDWEAWELLNQWYKERGYPSRRRMVLRMLLAYQPDREDLLRDLATLHEKMDELNDARQVLEKIERLKPDDIQIKQQSVRVLLKQGQIDEVYTRIKSLDHTEPVVHDIIVHLGQRLKFRQQYQKAEECLQLAAQTRPDSPQLWQILAELALQRQDYSEAFVRLCKANELNRNQASVWLPLAEYFSKTNDNEKAEACYECLFELTCYRVDLWQQIIKVAQLAGISQETKWFDRFYRWLELEQVHHQHWNTLADLYQKANQPEKAKQCLKNLKEFIQVEAQAQSKQQQEQHHINHPSQLISEPATDQAHEATGHGTGSGTTMADTATPPAESQKLPLPSKRHPSKRHSTPPPLSDGIFMPPPEFTKPKPAPTPLVAPDSPPPPLKTTSEQELEQSTPELEQSSSGQPTPNISPPDIDTSSIGTSSTDAIKDDHSDVNSPTPIPFDLPNPSPAKTTNLPKQNHPELHKDIDSIVSNAPDHT